MVIVGLLAVGVGLAIDKYNDRQNSRGQRNNRSLESHDTQCETGIISPEEARQKRESDAFNELQQYADFQSELSDKVLDELMKNDYEMDDGDAAMTVKMIDKISDTGYPAGHGANTRRHLLHPIFIPRHGIGNNGYGWARTYVPELMGFGIDQSAFLDFLDSFNVYLKASPVVDAINIGTQKAWDAWSDGTRNLSVAIAEAIELANADPIEPRRNSFLDHYNAAMFTPCGLHAMIITSRPEEESQILTINTSMTPPLSRINRDTSTINEDPEAAQTTSKLRQMSNFIADYSDKRSAFRPAPRFHQSLFNSSQGFNQSAAEPSNSPLSSLLSRVDKARVNNADTRKRRVRRGRPISRQSDGFSDTSEAAFGRPTMISESMQRAESAINTAGDGNGIVVQPGVLYLLIVNHPSTSQPSTPYNSPLNNPLPHRTASSKPTMRQQPIRWYYGENTTQTSRNEISSSNLPVYPNEMKAGSALPPPPAYTPSSSKRFYSAIDEHPS